MFRKFITAAAGLAVLTAALTGCAAPSDYAPSGLAATGRLSVVCTIFPVYDWTKEVIGENSGNVELTYLMNSGADLHNYQPTAEDMIKISDCDVFVYVGGESDKWVDDALAEARNKNMQVIDLMDVLSDSVREEELKEGMEGEEEEEDEEEEEGPEYDEHVWLSLRNAETCVKAISSSLAEADKANAAMYEKNAETYINTLDALDKSYTDMIGKAKDKTMIFGDRFPFRYFVEDYGLDYYAAFIGCSAETEASFETIAFLAKKTDEVKADTVFTIEGSDCAIAEAVINSTASKDQRIVTLNSAQSVTAEEIKNGANYVKIMEDNYSVLEEALN